MSELETITIYNPLKENFSVNFNGEPYVVPSQTEKSYPQFLAFHIAKHLTDKMLEEALVALKSKDEKNPYKPLVGQLMVYDNPKRRIALYKVLRTKELVETCMNNYPFKGFVGEMREYDEFVAEQEKTPATKSSDESGLAEPVAKTK